MARPHGPGTPKANPEVGLSCSIPSMSSHDTAEHQDRLPPTPQHPRAEPLLELDLSSSGSVSKYHRGPQGASGAPVAGGDLAAHCLGNTPCPSSAVPEGAAALREQWVCICTVPFARGISVDAANVTFLCGGYTHQSHPPTSAPRQVLRDGITRGMVEKRQMKLPSWDLVKTWAKPLLL